MNKPFKIVCHSFRTILEVKNLSAEELTAAYNVIKRRTKQYQGAPSTHTYMVMLAKIFLMDPKVLDSMREEVEDSDDPDATEKLREALEDIYLGIIGLYPSVTLEIILMDINSKASDFSWAEGILDPEGKDYSDKSMSKRAFSSMDEIVSLKKYLKRKVIGQDDAIDSVTDAIKLMGAGLEKHASFFFLGPTGVGKTYVSRLLGKRYSGNFCKINCSEYSSPHEYAKLLGAPPGYVNSTEGGVLAKKAEKGNDWVIVFDEIEKGHEKLHDLLLNLLDEGAVDDNKGDHLDFSKSIFICTSNIGLKDLKWNTVGFGSSDGNPYTANSAKQEIEKSLQRQFKDEFINRFDACVFFNQLTEEDIIKIASLELSNLPIEKTKDLLSYIAANGYSDRFGARELKRFIKKNVTIKVADSILCNEIPISGSKYTPEFSDDGELTIINTKQQEITHGLDAEKKRGAPQKKRKTTTTGSRSTGRKKVTKRRTKATSKKEDE